MTIHHWFCICNIYILEIYIISYIHIHDSLVHTDIIVPWVNCPLDYFIFDHDVPQTNYIKTHNPESKLNKNKCNHVRLDTKAKARIPCRHEFFDICRLNCSGENISRWQHHVLLLYFNGYKRINAISFMRKPAPSISRYRLVTHKWTLTK